MPPPQHIGPYQLVRPLGVGGMAETFLAVRRGPAGFEQRVCLKRILPAHTAEPRFLELFLDEARLLAHMHSAAIVQVFDFGEADGTYYMALELVEGIDLETLLHSCAKTNTRLPTSVSLYIAAQLLSALDYAHTLEADGQPLHIVHRDISPSNVLLSKHGEVKLTARGNGAPLDIDFNMCSDARDLERLVIGTRLMCRLQADAQVQRAVEQVFPISLSDWARRLAVHGPLNAAQTRIGAALMDLSGALRRVLIDRLIADAPSLDDLANDDGACREWIAGAVLGAWCVCVALMSTWLAGMPVLLSISATAASAKSRGTQSTSQATIASFASPGRSMTTATARRSPSCSAA